MKTLKQLSMALVLTLMLGTGALAGIIQTGEASPEPPESTPATAPDSASAVAPGIIQTGAPTQASTSTSVAEIALSVLQSVLSGF
jgi:hypothetical protein